MSVCSRCRAPYGVCICPGPQTNSSTWGTAFPQPTVAGWNALHAEIASLRAALDEANTERERLSGALLNAAVAMEANAEISSRAGQYAELMEHASFARAALAGEGSDTDGA